MISRQQIAGETAALDLLLARLTHDPEAIASATVDTAACPTTTACAPAAGRAAPRRGR
ncbi:hypothetical protein [Streptomyces sp. NPDC085540]|uniref:hypothetical protein n=1 Tax=Streptomyces sp. NPDC085540 TaxID=3365730 RepID=UPI0037D73984